MNFREGAIRFGAVGIGAALALGAVAAPAVAQPQRSTATVQAQATPAPAPTGLAYTYDAATQTVTITWDPKDPTDTITQSYSPGSCGPTPDYPCFIAVSFVITGNSWSFQKAPGTDPAYFRIYAQNAAHQYTGSAVLTVTV